MFEVYDGFILVVFGILFGFLTHLRSIINQISSRLNDVIDDLQSEQPSLNGLNGLKEELLDIVNDTIENLQPPSAIDHIAGAFSQFIQFRMMKEIKLDEMNKMLANDELEIEDNV